MDDDTKDVLTGLALIVGAGIVGAAVLRSMGSSKPQLVRRVVDPSCTCDSCGEDYMFSQSGSSEFCSDQCEERGALIKCSGCGDEYFRNKGYDKFYCGSSCYYTYED
ncbi:MAG: hypothetical protein KJ674_01175 [Nanoarchaeota archaeon]|nr:hypothetical protein [Nanoarchaeota archaeon]